MPKKKIIDTTYEERCVICRSSICETCILWVEATCMAGVMHAYVKQVDRLNKEIEVPG